MAAVAASRDASPVPPTSRGSAGAVGGGADPLLSLLSVLDMDGSGAVPNAAVPNAASAVEAAVMAAEAAANAAYGAVKSMAA